MIIAGIFDQATDKFVISCIRQMKKVCPNEIVVILDDFLHSELDQRKLFSDRDGNLTKRLTFIGHTWRGSIGDGRMEVQFSCYDPKPFAEALMKKLREAAMIIPELKQSITTIDLIGCHTGCVDKCGFSFAGEVAAEINKLQAEGFAAIQIKAPNNKKVREIYNSDIFFAQYNPANSKISAFGFKSSKDYQKCVELNTNILNINKKQVEMGEQLTFIKNEMIKLMELGKELEKKIEQTQEEIMRIKDRARIFLQKTTDLASESESESDDAHHQNKLAELSHEKNLLENMYDEKKSELNTLKQELDEVFSKYTECKHNRQALETEYQNYFDEKEVLMNELLSLRVVTHESKNIRKALDADPDCNFTLQSAPSSPSSAPVIDSLVQESNSNNNSNTTPRI